MIFSISGRNFRDDINLADSSFVLNDLTTERCNSLSHNGLVKGKEIPQQIRRQSYAKQFSVSSDDLVLSLPRLNGQSKQRERELGSLEVYQKPISLLSACHGMLC